METTTRQPANSPPLRNGRTVLPRPKRRHRATKLQPLTPAALDGRTNAAKLFDTIATSIAKELDPEAGGDRLSTIQKHLIESFAGLAISMHGLNVRLLLNQEVDIAELAQVSNGLVRIC